MNNYNILNKTDWELKYVFLLWKLIFIFEILPTNTPWPIYMFWSPSIYLIINFNILSNYTHLTYLCSMDTAKFQKIQIQNDRLKMWWTYQSSLKNWFNFTAWINSKLFTSSFLISCKYFNHPNLSRSITWIQFI